MNLSTELSPSEEMATMEFDVGTAAACVILGLSFLVGVPGNLLVIWTILRCIKQRSHTVVLILQLAAADLLVLITLPVWIYSLVYSWVFGEAFCKALVYIISVCMFSSIFFITLMSVERFLAICHPFSTMHWMTKSAMNRCLVLLWLLAILVGAPVLLTQSLDENDGSKQCFVRKFSSVTPVIIMLCLETFGGFFFPFIIISICYCLVTAQLRRMEYNDRQKSLVLVYTVVIAFLLCWFPYHIINITDLVCIFKSGSDYDCVPASFILCSGALVFINSSLNPVLYALLARNFRGNLEDSRMVRLFKEMATHANRLMELGVKQQTSQRAANTQVELMSDQCEKN
ncbi:delta-type opioid receptor-like [Platichthys flesus]|uniref:delta-type opioid receptor-like n=1 Tax=Platichthys flesus TaxID=8260 RepID=UPI002DBCDFC0|nr:delta-type opioid receptor-like [Platichthys flesus]